MTTQRKLVLLGSLYLAQGLPYGFFTQALPVLLRESGTSLPRIGLTGLLALPWALKFLWAPRVDAIRAPRFGRRRAVITPLQFAVAAVLATLALAADPAAMWPLFIAVLLVNLFSATQDIATDGLAVELLGADERGLGNGLQVGAYRLGMIIGGGAMLWVFAAQGWSAAFLMMSALVLLTTVPILNYAGADASGVRAREEPGSVHGWLSSLRRPGMSRWILVLLTFKTGEWFATGMLRTFLSDSKQSLADIGLMLGVVGFSAAFAGSMTGGALMAKLGRRTALTAFGVAQTLAIASGSTRCRRAGTSSLRRTARLGRCPWAGCESRATAAPCAPDHAGPARAHGLLPPRRRGPHPRTQSTPAAAPATSSCAPCPGV